MEHSDALQQTRQLVEERRPDASPQKKAAFANSVAYLVTGWSGGFGGPSVREHAATRLYGSRKPYDFQEAVDLLLDENGPIFGPLTSVHRACWREEHCFDDDPSDVEQLVPRR